MCDYSYKLRSQIPVDVLVTGATGFIGRHLCRFLSEKGHTVFALSRNTEAAKKRLPWIKEVFAWHPLNRKPPTSALEPVEAVVHLAGERVVGLWTSAKKRAIMDSRINSTRFLVETLDSLEKKPSVLVSASAVGFYGDQGETVLTEESPPGSDFLSDVCRQWETAAQDAGRLGIRVVNLRIGLVLGSDGGMLPSLLPAAKLGLLGPLGSGRQWWPWIHINDVIGMVGYALDHVLFGPLNATAPNPVRQAEFARTLNRLLKRPMFFRIPRFALKLAGDFASEVLSSKRVLPEKANQAGYEFVCRELEPALDGLIHRSRRNS